MLEEDNDALGQYHLKLSIIYTPKSSSPKVFLFKSKTLMVLNRRDESCDVVFQLYDTITSVEHRAIYPLIINNFGKHSLSCWTKPFLLWMALIFWYHAVLCATIRNGLSKDFVNHSIELLKTAKLIVSENKRAPRYVVKIAACIHLLKRDNNDW